MSADLESRIAGAARSARRIPDPSWIWQRAGRRRRYRRTAVGAAVVIAVVLVAAGGVWTIATPDRDATLASHGAARGASVSLPDHGGYALHDLPEGLQLIAVEGRPAPQLGRFQHVRMFRHEDEEEVWLRVAVSYGTDVGSEDPTAGEVVDVRGTRGILHAAPEGWMLAWVERPGVAISLHAAGVSSEQLLATAAGMTPLVNSPAGLERERITDSFTVLEGETGGAPWSLRHTVTGDDQVCVEVASARTTSATCWAPPTGAEPLRTGGSIDADRQLHFGAVAPGVSAVRVHHGDTVVSVELADSPHADYRFYAVGLDTDERVTGITLLAPDGEELHHHELARPPKP